MLLCVQLGAGSESEAAFKTLKPHLITVIQDQTAGAAARASVRMSTVITSCQALSANTLIIHT